MTTPKKRTKQPKPPTPTKQQSRSRGGTAARAAETEKPGLAAKLESKLAESVEKRERAAERSAKRSQKHERAAEHAARGAAMLEQLADHLNAFDVWTREGPATRKPRFSRDEIAATAVRIADAEGLDALSMRRLAAELGAGTMTLYHYIRTKDELLTLVTDTVMGEVALDDDEVLPDDWRAALKMIATRSKDALSRHAWMLDIADDPPFGPNAVRHFDQTLQALASLDAPLETKLDIAMAVDEYVFGYCMQARNNTAVDDRVEQDRHVVDYVSGLIDGGGYPQLAALVDAMGTEAVWNQIWSHLRDGGRFERNLDRVLDGVEVGLRDA